MKYIILLLIIIIAFSCSSTGTKNKLLNSNTIDYIDIYCWCFDFTDNLMKNRKINDSIMDITPNLCLTPVSISYKQIVTSSFLKKRISNRKLTKKFKKHFISPQKIDHWSDVDARLAFVIRYQNEEKDTIVYVGQNNMYMPRYGIFEYNFNVDSLLVLIGDGFSYSCE